MRRRHLFRMLPLLGIVLTCLRPTAQAQSTLTAVTSATCGGAALTQTDPCGFPYQSPGPIAYSLSASYTCNDPEAHPENMPGGTAFTYPNGSGGAFTTNTPGQCFYVFGPLLVSCFLSTCLLRLPLQ